MQGKLCVHSLHGIVLYQMAIGDCQLTRCVQSTIFALIHSNLLQFIPNFYNTKALHDLAVEIFFKMQKSGAREKVRNVAVAQKARHKFVPEFSIAALSLLVIMVSVANVSVYN